MKHTSPTRIAAAVLIGILLVGCKKEENSTTKSDQLTDQQKTEIAAQVMRGERPQSDLQKYGIKIGERKEISIEDFQKQVAKSRPTTQP